MNADIFRYTFAFTGIICFMRIFFSSIFFSFPWRVQSHSFSIFHKQRVRSKNFFVFQIEYFCLFVLINSLDSLCTRKFLFSLLSFLILLWKWCINTVHLIEFVVERVANNNIIKIIEWINVPLARTRKKTKPSDCLLLHIFFSSAFRHSWINIIFNLSIV